MAPGTEPLKYRILEAVAAAIAAIEEGDDYYTDVAGAHVLRGNTVHLNSLPAAIIVYDGHDESDAILGTIEGQMDIEIGLYIGGMGDNWRRDLLRFEADVAKALRSSSNLGGLVGDLHVQRGHLLPKEADGSVAVAQTGMHVIYRHPYLDPTTALTT